VHVNFYFQKAAVYRCRISLLFFFIQTTACYINYGNADCYGKDPNGWDSRQAYWYAANDCLGISGADASANKDGVQPGTATADTNSTADEKTVGTVAENNSTTPA